MSIDSQEVTFERESPPYAAVAELIRPTPLVITAETLLPRCSQVLDLGAYNGRNGFYLAQEGHTVTSVELESEYIETGQRIAASLGAAGLRNSFIQGNMAELVSGFNNFDATIATSSLHMIARSASLRTVAGIKNSVKPNGLNIIESYVASADQQALVPHRTLFSPNELFRIYKEDGWEVIDQASRKGIFGCSQDGTFQFSSCDSLIARRRPAPRRRTIMGANRQLMEVECP